MFRVAIAMRFPIFHSIAIVASLSLMKILFDSTKLSIRSTKMTCHFLFLGSSTNFKYLFKLTIFFVLLTKKIFIFGFFRFVLVWATFRGIFWLWRETLCDPFLSLFFSYFGFFLSFFDHSLLLILCNDFKCFDHAFDLYKVWEFLGVYSKEVV